MPKRGEKTRLQLIAKVIQVADLRIRLEFPTREAARETSRIELIAAYDALLQEIKDLA